MKVHFGGVRGSVPVPGANTVRYGGNTSCVSVELDTDHTLLLDAGTGIRMRGLDATGEPHTYYLLLSHLHWDHIQGFPFFYPKMDPGAKIHILCEMQEGCGEQILEQLDGVNFPLKADDLRADIQLCATSIKDLLRQFEIKVSWMRMNHPGQCFGFRIDAPRGSLVYMADNELHGTRQSGTTWEDFRSFAHQADILIHDAQYIDEDMPAKRGWGHSLVDDACDLAAESEVKRLILFHHDPERTDSQIDVILASARHYLAKKNPAVQCDAAYEGMELNI